MLRGVFRSREWNRHELSGARAFVGMSQWGWMQGAGEICLPGLSPCVGIVVKSPEQKLVVAGHFPSQVDPKHGSGAELLPVVLEHVQHKIALEHAGVWIGGGALSGGVWPRVDELVMQNREYVQAMVNGALPNVPTEVEFSAPLTYRDYIVDVASGLAR